MSERSTNQDQPPAARPRSAAEWTTLLVSLTVVFLLVGAALYEHFGREEPPGTEIEVRVLSAEALLRSDLYYVPFKVINRGAAPARDVTVVFEVKRGEEVVEESTVLIPFLANSGSADGTVMTGFDPATHLIEARPATLLNP